MTELRPAVEMKDSGIEWVGQIPRNWTYAKLKYLYVSTNAGEVIDKGYWHIGDELLYTCQRTPMRSNYTDFPDRKRTTESDLLLTRNATPYVFIPERNSIYSNVVQRIVIVSDIEKRYVRYGLLCGVLAEQVYGNTIPSWNMEVWNNIFIPIPTFQEQLSIADYLDDLCSKVDEIIAEATASIEEYKDLKQAVIFEVVTKGLDKNAPMKDSGIEWIGDVPIEWRVIRLKYLLLYLVDCPHETPNYIQNGEYHVIRTADQDLGFLRPDENMYRLDEKEYLSRVRRLRLEKDDIVYGREGERWGLACLIPESNKYCLGQRMLHFRCKKDVVLPEYLMWALNSTGVRMQGVLDTLGSTSPHVNISTVKNFRIPIPDIYTQGIIIKHLSKRISEIDALISEKQSLIDDLQAYKKSLIYEVVTGKRRVV